MTSPNIKNVKNNKKVTNVLRLYYFSFLISATMTMIHMYTHTHTHTHQHTHTHTHTYIYIYICTYARRQLHVTSA